MTTTELKQNAQKPLFTSAELFRFSIDLLLNNRIHPVFINLLENVIPSESQIFVLFGNDFVYPQNFAIIRAEEIHRLIDNNKTGFYRKETNFKTEDNFETMHLISVSCAGSNLVEKDLIIGLAYTEGWNGDAECEVSFYEIISQMRKFFEEFSKSNAIKKFLEEKSDFRYIIDSAGKEIIAGHPEFDETSSEKLSPINEYITDHLALRILQPDNKLHNNSLDNRFKNIILNKCTMADAEYILLTVNMTREIMQNKMDFDTLVRNFSHKIRSKLGALQAATSQLAIQKGRVLDEDDITLVEIIQTATNSIFQMIDRLHQYSQLTEIDSSQIDLNQLINEMMAEPQVESEVLPELDINLDPSLKTFSGNAEQIKIALGEVFNNAIISGLPGGKIKIDTNQDRENIRFNIFNEMAPTKIDQARLDKVDYFEPFFSLRSEAVGLGLTIARRIVESHGGNISIDNTDQKCFRVAIDLPVLRGEGK